MTKEEILAAAGYPNTPEGVAAFYNEYGTPEAFFAKHGGSLSGAPHNGQPTADQFFSYGSHANDQINIPMGNPFYLQTGGMYHSDGPFYHAQDGVNVTFAQPKTSAQYNRMKTNLGYTDEELKGVGVSKPGLSEQFLQKEKELKGTYKPATGGGYTMIGEDPSKVYDYYVGQGYKLRGMPDVASTLPPQRYGGGLPGGPHEMPCMECGGYMQYGGYNSPTNYGAFSVPMIDGGLPIGQDQEFGGAYDPSVAGTYPSMNKGGLKKIINAFVKKAYGGDTVIPGGNDTDYPQQIRSNFMKGVSNLYQKALTDEITNDFYQEMTNIPMARDGWQAGQQRLINKLYTEPSFGATPQFTPLPKKQMYSEGARTPDQYENVYYRGSGPEGSSKKGAYRFSFQDPRSFPGIFDSYYKINKRNVDKAKKALDEGYGLADVEKVYGLGARTAMNIGNIFRKAENKKTEPGFAPKKIKYTFTKPKPGIVDFFDTTADTLPSIPTNLPTYSPESAELMLPKARVGNNPIDMSEQQDKITVTAKEKKQLTPEAALFGSTAAGFLGDTITNFQRKLAAEREMYPMPGSDNSPFGAVAGSHGEYTINQGFLQPQMYTPGMQENRIMTSAEGGELVKALSGLEIKMRPGLYGTNGNRQFSLPTQIDSQKYAEPEVKVGGILGPVDRSVANLEAEKGETAYMELGGLPAHFTIGGKRHSEGGTPLNLPDNSFIFSDTAKMKIKDPVLLLQFGMPIKKGGYTPADIAKKYDINKYRKVLADKESDETEIKTAELMIAKYNIKLAKLAIIQEAMKGFPQGIPAIAMPYILSNNVEITELLGKVNPEALTAQQMEDEQEMSTEGMEDNPNADMGVSRFGGNIVAQFNTKAHGGMHFAGYPYYQNGGQEQKPSIYDVLDNMERNLLRSIGSQRDLGMSLQKSTLDAWDKYKQLRKKYGPSLTKEVPEGTPISWVNTDGQVVGDPTQGTTGYWDRVKKYWSGDPDIGNIDPAGIELAAKTKGKLKYPTLAATEARKTLRKVIHPSEAEGILDYAGNLLSIPGKGTSALLTGNIETAGQTYLRSHPGNVGTAMAIDFISDPTTYLGAGPVKGLYQGAKQLPKAYAWARYLIPEYYTLGKEFAKKYGKKAYDAIESLLKDPNARQILENMAVSGATRVAGASQYDKMNTAAQQNDINNLRAASTSQATPAMQPAVDRTSVLQPPKVSVESVGEEDWDNIDWSKYKEQ